MPVVMIYNAGCNDLQCRFRKCSPFYIRRFHSSYLFIDQDMDELGTFADGSVNGCDTSSKLNSPPYLPGRYPLKD